MYQQGRQNVCPDFFSLRTLCLAIPFFRHLKHFIANVYTLAGPKVHMRPVHREASLVDPTATTPP